MRLLSWWFLIIRCWKVCNELLRFLQMIQSVSLLPHTFLSEKHWNVSPNLSSSSILAQNLWSQESSFQYFFIPEHFICRRLVLSYAYGYHPINCVEVSLLSHLATKISMIYATAHVECSMLWNGFYAWHFVFGLKHAKISKNGVVGCWDWTCFYVRYLWLSDVD